MTSNGDEIEAVQEAPDSSAVDQAGEAGAVDPGAVDQGIAMDQSVSEEGSIRASQLAEAPVTLSERPKKAVEKKPEALAAIKTEMPSQPEEEEQSEEQKEANEPRFKLPWYVVQTYSGYEMRVKLSLEERIRSNGLSEKFGKILVPQETVEEMVKGAKRTTKKKFFPGYILVQMDLNDDTWHLVKETQKVSGFIGDSRNPSPLSEEEVASLLLQMEGGAKRPRPKKNFEEGDSVKVTDGPFADFNGTVDEVKPDKGKLRVLISIFGRNTPVELDFGQVEKV